VSKSPIRTASAATYVAPAVNVDIKTGSLCQSWAVGRGQIDAAPHPRHARQRVDRRVLLHGFALRRVQVAGGLVGQNNLRHWAITARATPTSCAVRRTADFGYRSFFPTIWNRSRIVGGPCSDRSFRLTLRYESGYLQVFVHVRLFEQVIALKHEASLEHSRAAWIHQGDQK